jgi:hypothetical protein
MLRKKRTPWMIAAGLPALAALLLPAGCGMSPVPGQTPMPPPQIGQPGSATPLPSLCTSVETQSYPSDAFRLKILVKNSAGAQAPGARVRVTFYHRDTAGPVQIWADDHGIAVLALTAEQLALPDASGHTSGTLGFDLSALWNNPNSGPEYLATCASQDIDLAAPAEIVVTVTLLP